MRSTNRTRIHTSTLVARVLLSGNQQGLIVVSSGVTGMTLRILNDHRGHSITSIKVDNKVALRLQSLDSFLLNTAVCMVQASGHWFAVDSSGRISVWKADWALDRCDLVAWTNMSQLTDSLSVG